MATFTDTIKLILNMDVDKSASGGLGKIRDDIDQTDGAWNKLKVGAGGAFDFVKSNALGFAAGAGAAIGAFAVSAVSDFQDLALSSGKLRDALGLSADESSRWVEVAGDLGIGTDALQTSMGRMLKTAGATPQVFADLGVEIKRTADGSVDASGTFLNVIDRLHNMSDPAERAAAAQKLLGKSWQDSAELIELGADGVKARLDEVSGAKILSDDQIGEARRFRDAMDDLGDQVDNLKLAIAEGLVPTLTDIASAVGPAVEAFGKLHDAAERIADIPVAGALVKQFLHPLDGVKTAVDTVGDAWDAVFGSGGTTSTSGEVSEQFLKRQADLLREHAALSDEELAHRKELAARTIQIFNDQSAGAKTWAQAASEASVSVISSGGQVIENTDSMRAASEWFGQVQEDVAETVANVAEKLRDQADALNEDIDQMRNAADATIAVEDAQRNFADAARESTLIQLDATRSTEDKEAAVRAERDAMLDAANAAVAKAGADAQATGVTQTATGKVDTFNDSLLANAHFATPAARNAIADYIIEANGVPPSKSTDIRAAIARGDFDTAASLLAGLSAARTAAVRADADTAAAERELNNTARPRTSVINVQYNAPLGVIGQARAKGGPVRKGMPYMVGEEGPEPFIPDQNGTIVPTGAALNAGGTPLGIGGGGAAPVVLNATFNMPVGTNPVESGRQVGNVLTAWLRTGGAETLRRELGL